ncbi:MAG: sensor domain-containing phosphodiesterase [Janthinobacterium lividum]
MPCPEPVTEAARLASVLNAGILDTPPDHRFDAITRLAARMLDVPQALVTLIDASRQWVKSGCGPVAVGSVLARDVAFCAHTIMTPGQVLVVEDASADARFRDNPMASGPGAIRFYAGAPLLDADGHALGALCVLDTRPRGFSAEDEATLRDLALGVSALIELERSSAALRRDRERFRHAVELNRQVPWQTDAQGRVIEVGEGWPTLFGQSCADALNGGWRKAIHPDDQAWVVDAWQRAVAEEEAFDVECRYLMANGGFRWFRALGALSRDAIGVPAGWFGTVEDIHDRKLAERALRESEEHHRYSVEVSPQIPWTADPGGQLEEVSPKLSLLTGLDEAAILRDGWAQFTHPEDQPGVWHRWARSAETGEPYDVEYRIRVADGSYCWFHVRAFARRTGDGRIMRWYGTAEDITGRRADQARISHMALHDGLTGLANRAMFQERMQQELARVGRGAQLAVLCVDLDDFKAINDRHGHAEGDRLLRQVAERLGACLRETDVVARFGSDEFVVIQTALDQPENAAALARRIIEVVGRPYELGGRAVAVGATVGVSVAPQDGSSAERLFQSADMALSRAKAEGRGGFRFFEQGMHEQQQARGEMLAELRHAVSRGEMAVHFQPLVDVGSGRIASFEALLRWEHPVLGAVSPTLFVPLAEETGLIRAIGEWVAREACRAAATWPDGIGVAVNLSPVQLRDAELPQRLAAIAREAGLAPARLELEVTESMMLDDREGASRMLEAFHALGMSIAMDDFGTGYSSLRYLHTFRFDKLKIDQSFVGRLTDSEESRAIVRAVLSLSRDLGLRTVAEGVETAAQLEQLRAYGCDLVQGFLFSRAVPGSEVAGLIRAFGHDAGEDGAQGRQFEEA